MSSAEQSPLVAVIMGSDSDLEFMGEASDVLDELGVENEIGFTSAHRTPKHMDNYVESAEERGIKVIIAGAGGSAHLPGMVASKTLLPVKGVAIGRTPEDIDAAIKSQIYMPSGVDLDFMGVNKAGANKAALSAVRVLALLDPALAARNVSRWARMGDTVLAKHALIASIGKDEYRAAQREGRIPQLLAEA